MADQISSAADNQRRPLQLFVKLLNSETLSLQFPTPVIEARSVKRRIYEITKIPVQLQRLIRGHQLKDDSVIFHSDATLNLSLRLLGGKGGFGSLLRGAATKAGQKKTSNFEACRDMSGRRLRHVNAERRLEEWKAEEEQRRLEKIAEDFIKKKAKKGKKGVGDGETTKYVEKYRAESAKCVAVVEESVREAFKNRKRKTLSDGADAKRLKIWMGKRKMDDDMDGDSSEDEGDEDEESEKSVVLNNNGNHSDSNKGTQGSPGSVTGGTQGRDFSGGASAESGSEEERENSLWQGLGSGKKDVPNVDNTVLESDFHEEKVVQSSGRSHTEPAVITGTEAPHVERLENNEFGTENKEELGSLPPKCVSWVDNGVVNGQLINAEVNSSPDSKSGADEETAASRANIAESDKPLNFDEFNSPEEMEVLGMERLKSELQERGLKCGGTLQERAARLFLLKSTPLEKLPKKLLAKK
ncbi:hypothetical protein SLE2022_029890 [Rubroshorea leprosula]